MVTGGQGGGFMMFNTQSGNNVIIQLEDFISAAAKQKTIALKFDAFLALTLALNEYDFWINDNEMWEEGGQLVCCFVDMLLLMLFV